MSKTKAVIYWPETEQVSTEDLSLINEEDRYQNAVTTIKMGSKLYRAVVRFISSDKLKLDEVEEKVGAEIEGRVKAKEAELTEKGGRGSRKRGRERGVDGVASSNQVASALGERLKPTAEQAPKAKELALKKKRAEVAQKSAQDEVDRDALHETASVQSAKRSLDFEASEGEDGVDDSDDDNQEAFESDDAPEPSEQPSNANCCIHCLELRKGFTQSPEVFLKALNKFCGALNTAGTQYIETLEIPDGVMRSELSKGSKVFISNADKNAIKRDGSGDPSKMTRLGLLALFGRDALEREAVTAKGQKSGTKGIRKNVRDALRAFVNRNKGKTYKELNETKFNQVINKKKSQVHRVRKNPQPREKVSKKSSQAQAETRSPVKSTTPELLSPPKNTPVRQSSTVRRSPFYESPVKVVASKSPVKSPWKVTPRNEACTPSSYTYQQPQGVHNSVQYPNTSQGYYNYYPQELSTSSWTGQGTYSSPGSEEPAWYNNFSHYTQC